MAYQDESNLTSLATLKAWIGGISDSNADSVLTALIQRASGFILSYISVDTMFSATITAKRNGNGKSRMITKVRPITAVTSVTIDGVSIPASPDGIAAGYVFDDFSIYLIGYRFTRGIQNVTLVYTGGVTPITSKEARILEQACLELCAQKWKRRSHVDQVSQNSNGVQSTVFSTKDMPSEVRTALDQLENVVMVRT